MLNGVKEYKANVVTIFSMSLPLYMFNSHRQFLHNTNHLKIIEDICNNTQNNVSKNIKFGRALKEIKLYKSTLEIWFILSLSSSFNSYVLNKIYIYFIQL